MRPSEETAAAPARTPRAPAASGKDTHVLQTLMAPMSGAPAGLYFSAPNTHRVGDESGVLLLPDGGRLSTAAYFNSFFLDFWRVHTAIARLGVECRAAGAMHLRAVAHYPGGATRVLAEWDHPQAAANHSIFWIWAREGEATGGEAIGRIHLEIEAPFGATIEGLDYVTDTAPPNRVKLSVGLCTFEREEPIEKTVEVLHQLLDASDVARVHIVNQGRRFRRPRLTSLLRHPAFSVVEQANLGGTGGFTRAIVEATESTEHPTHLLIMDDDIVLDPRVVVRAKTFAAYVAHDCAIGGQAIELESRVHLQEVGGMLGPNWLVRTIGRDSDLLMEATLAMWDRAFAVDYNAWWFCVIPISAISRCGLPAPIFLHGDDVEYGCRLRAAGIETVPLPGLGVWHSSFRYKHAGLIHYYDLRNLLINAATHPEVSNLPGPVFVLGWMIHYLLVHRYRAALSSMIALRDFLAGPEVALGPDSCTRHLRLRDAVNVLTAPDAREGVQESTLVLAPAGVADPSILRQALLYFRLFFRILLMPVPRKERLLVKGQPLPENTGGAPYLLATGPKAERCLVLRPKRMRMFLMTMQALFLALRYALGYRRAARRWVASIGELRSRARWEREFARKRE